MAERKVEIGPSVNTPYVQNQPYTIPNTAYLFAKTQQCIKSQYIEENGIVNGEYIIGLYIRVSGTVQGDVKDLRIKATWSDNAYVSTTTSFADTSTWTTVHISSLISASSWVTDADIYLEFNQDNYLQYITGKHLLLDISRMNDTKVGVNTASGAYILDSAGLTGEYRYLAGYGDDPGQPYPYDTISANGYAATSRTYFYHLQVTDTLPSTAPILTATQNEQAISLSWTYP